MSSPSDSPPRVPPADDAPVPPLPDRAASHALSGRIVAPSSPMSRLDQVGNWIESLRTRNESALTPPDNLEAALHELLTAQEELRVAEEELMVQSEELQLAHIELEAERERYRSLFDLAPDGYIVTDLNGVMHEANQSAAQQLGVAQRFLCGKPLVNYVALEHRPEFRNVLSRLTSVERLHWQVDILPRHGIAFPASLTVSVEHVVDRQNSPQPVLRWLIRDETERQHTEHQLADVNEVLQTLVQAAPLSVIVLDKDANVTLWNPTAQQLFGWDSEEVVGRPLPIVPAKHRARFEKQHRESMEGIRHEEVETERMRKDGSLLEVLNWTAPLRSKTGEVVASLCVIADNTERKSAEAVRSQLLARVVSAQEEERARISRELHDHLGQYLTGIMLGLQELQGNTAELPCGERRSTAGRLAKLRAVVDELMLVSHRQAWELRPAELDSMGLAAAVEHYILDWAERSHLDADFHARGFETRRLEETVEITLYRVVQEALTNVARHSGASRVDVVLELSAQAAMVIMEDNGRGFDVKTMSKGRLGLTGMQERMSLVGGNLEIESSPGNGTTVFARVPRPIIRTMDSDSPDTLVVENPALS